jgi:hypothetical protein
MPHLTEYIRQNHPELQAEFAGTGVVQFNFRKALFHKGSEPLYKAAI